MQPSAPSIDEIEDTPKPQKRSKDDNEVKVSLFENLPCSDLPEVPKIFLPDTQHWWSISWCSRGHCNLHHPDEWRTTARYGRSSSDTIESQFLRASASRIDSAAIGSIDEECGRLGCVVSRLSSRSDTSSMQLRGCFLQEPSHSCNEWSPTHFPSKDGIQGGVLRSLRSTVRVCWSDVALRG